MYIPNWSNYSQISSIFKLIHDKCPLEDLYIINYWNDEKVKLGSDYTLGKIVRNVVSLSKIGKLPSIPDEDGSISSILDKIRIATTHMIPKVKVPASKIVIIINDDILYPEIKVLYLNLTSKVVFTNLDVLDTDKVKMDLTRLAELYNNHHTCKIKKYYIMMKDPDLKDKIR